MVMPCRREIVSSGCLIYHHRNTGSVADGDAIIEGIMSELRSRSDEEWRADMARFSVNVDTALGGTRRLR